MPGEQDGQGGADKGEGEQAKAKPPPASEQGRKARAAAPEAAKKRQQTERSKAGKAKPPSGWAGWRNRPDYVFAAFSAAFTGVLVVLTFFYVRTTERLWEETRASVETASAALRIAEMSERPWVVVDSISTPPQREGELGVIAIAFTNTGTIPAVGGEVKVFTWLAGSVDHPGGPEMVKKSVDAAGPQNVILIAPDQTTEVVFPYERTDGEIRWRQSAPVFAVAGAYLYLDASGSTRELRFCFWHGGLDLRQGDPWEPCPYHNSSN